MHAALLYTQRGRSRDGFSEGGKYKFCEVILKLHSWHQLFGQYEISYMTSMDCVCSLIVMLTTAVQLLRIERSAVHPLTRWTMHVGRSDSRMYQVTQTSGVLTTADVQH